MKILIYLEKSKAFWSLVILSIGFFLLRLPSLIEPYWYGDEGIYQTIGLALNNGHLLYSEIWDNKPPLLYVTYALLGGDQFSARLASLIVGGLTLVAFFLLSQLLYKKLSASILASSLFVLLFATPYLEGNIANAENFILLPIITSGLIIFGMISKHRLLVNRPQHLLLISIGFLLGIAFLFKIVAVFDFLAFFLFFTIFSLPQKNLFSWKSAGQIFTQGLPLLSGFMTPILITCAYFLINNSFVDFFQSAFTGNIGYVGWKNNFIIPQGFLILKVILLVGFLGVLFWKRHLLAKPTLFILIWLALEMFSSFFSQRPYTHYVLMMLPTFCLFVGLVATRKTLGKKIGYTLLALLIWHTVTQNFYFYGFKKSVGYYTNATQFVLGQKNIDTYQAFFDRKTPRDYTIASYINSHAQASDSLFLWGDSAQIYALTKKLPPGRYTVAYHMKQNKQSMQETEIALKKANPRYIIALEESGHIPFSLPGYAVRYTINGGTIYERTY